MKTWITPSLVVVESTDTVDAAFKQVKGGLIGTVTTMDEAREVMARLGMTEQEQDTRINFALTGKLSADVT